MRKHTQLVDKGLNNDLYNYKGGVFPIGENTASFCSHLYKCRQSASLSEALKSVDSPTPLNLTTRNGGNFGSFGYAEPLR